MAEIEKLQALTQGTPGNSTGADVAKAVNALIDRAAELPDGVQESIDNLSALINEAKRYLDSQVAN
ncbi:uncharacterized protein METZ01_LOCUS373325, partial [marine metagenome]